MVFWFVFLCLFWWFKARKRDVFKITVGLTQKLRKRTRHATGRPANYTTQSNVSPKKSYLPYSLTQKNHGPQKNSLWRKIRPNLSWIRSRIDLSIRAQTFEYDRPFAFSLWSARNPNSKEFEECIFPLKFEFAYDKLPPLASLRETFGPWQKLLCGHPSGEFIDKAGT